MDRDRTELEWNYEPRDFFEAPYEYAESNFELRIDSGRAIAILTTAADLETHVRSFVKNTFSVRQVQVHRSYTLEGPTMSRYSSGHKNVTVEVGSAVMALTSGRVDFIIQDPAGNVLRDSKAERIADDTSLEDSLPAIQKRSRTLPMNLHICTRFATQFHIIMETSTPRARLWELAKAIGNA
jgi:hypothetical protein